MAEDPLRDRTPSQSSDDTDGASDDSNSGGSAADSAVDDVLAEDPAAESETMDADERPDPGGETRVPDDTLAVDDPASSLDELAASVRERSAGSVDTDGSLSSLVSDRGLEGDENGADPWDPSASTPTGEQRATAASTDDDPDIDGVGDERMDPATPADSPDAYDGGSFDGGAGDGESTVDVTSADLEAHLDELATGIGATAGGDDSAGTDDQSGSECASDGTDASSESAGTHVGPIEHADLGAEPASGEGASSTDRLRALANQLRPGGGDAGANTSESDTAAAESGVGDAGFPPTAGGSGPGADSAGGRSFDDPGTAFGGMSTAPWQPDPTDPGDVLAALDGEDATEDEGDADVSDARHVLLSGGLDCPACNARCIDLLTERAPTEVNALFVTVCGGIDERLEDWQAQAGGYPANASLVTVGGGSQPSGSSAVIETRSGPDRITVDAVSDPADLTRLGVTLTRRLEEWSSNPYPTVLCLDSLTELLQYVELRRLFRFVHVLQNTLARVDGRAHYHLDPDAHEPRTVRLFETLVEATVTVADDD